MPQQKGHRTNWLAIRTYYVEGHTPTECSAKFGVARETISRRASKEGWAKQRHANITDAQRILDRVDAEARAQQLGRHEAVADSLVKEIAACIASIPGATDAKGNPLSVRSKAETLMTLAQAADKSVRLSRDVRGIADGAASIDQDADGDGSVRIVRTIVPAPDAAATHA